jgi:hypothetical protein
VTWRPAAGRGWLRGQFARRSERATVLSTEIVGDFLDPSSENPKLILAFLIQRPVTQNINCQFSVVPITFTPDDFACQFDRDGVWRIRSQAIVPGEDGNLVRQHDDGAVGFGQVDLNPPRKGVIHPSSRYASEVRHERQAVITRPARLALVALSGPKWLGIVKLKLNDVLDARRRCAR